MTSFLDRHLGFSEAELTAMAAELGFASADELIATAVPEKIKILGELALPSALSETAQQSYLTKLAEQNFPGKSLIGLGYYGTVTPAVIRRNILENPAWYTAYTPYQPEISQGRLEALLVFQTLVSELTALPMAGASLLDEATAAAEAVMLAGRVQRKRTKVLVDSGVLPATLQVIQTRALPIGLEVESVDLRNCDFSEYADSLACVVVASPTVDGEVLSTAMLQDLAERVHSVKGLVIAISDPLYLTLGVAPGHWGADMACGSMQRFGVPLFFGGPHAGFLAVTDKLARQLPGRLVGVSKDSHGNLGIRLTLQSREQHIRREKATSNICTSQVLLAVTAACYAVYHGITGLRGIAENIHGYATRFAAGLTAAGYELSHDNFFDTLVFEADALALQKRAREAGYHIRVVDEKHVGLSFGEDLLESDLLALAEVFGVDLTEKQYGNLGDLRQDEILQDPVFLAYHSETEMMRYLRMLSDRDLALDRSMIPLGSCTLKLNSATEMEPISYPGFANLHPYVPVDDSKGFRTLIADLTAWLAEITGYDAVSVQPNAGSQGEYAGLMAIRSYHQSRGEGHRNICLIPASAHGTNAASAAMAGMKVVVVKTAEDGSIDLVHFSECLAEYGSDLAAIMVTYPSTHGVFEDTVTTVCEEVHRVGGQVYLDGANFNALMGIAQPGKFGSDASHLNLHKTFAIPHGGGGPGVGPICVKAHLEPFLPKHCADAAAGPKTSYGPISGAPFGSAGVLAISHSYIAMSGAAGLRAASVSAIVAANYVSHKLKDAYPTLYAGANGLVAHECILDLRPLTDSTGITVDDVAKRLMDYGFHAPTMSFPVPGTLMVEPTESESLAELNRFIEAMLAIRAEIDCVAQGQWPAEDNPLVNAPHPINEIIREDWSHPYSREIAAFPMGIHCGPLLGSGKDKYWPTTGRIDSAYGDRNLMCSCPPISVEE